jgi:hypothetical protein
MNYFIDLKIKSSKIKFLIEIHPAVTKIKRNPFEKKKKKKEKVCGPFKFEIHVSPL